MMPSPAHPLSHPMALSMCYPVSYSLYSVAFGELRQPKHKTTAIVG